MEYESDILKRLIKTYGVVGNPRYISEIIKEFIVQGKERFPNLFTYQADWLAHIDEFGLTPEYTVSYTGQSIYAPNTLERPVKRAILSGNTLVNIENTLFPKTTGWYDNNGANSFYRNAEIISMMNPNTDYLLYVEALPTVSQFLSVSGGLFGAKAVNLTNGKAITKVTTTDVLPSQATNYFKSSVGGNLTQEEKESIKLMIIKYQDGMENWDISYFEGMQSVKMPVLTTSNEDGTKTNILTVNEPVELRGIGNVRDELNCLTGEVTERIGEIVLNGSENWILRKTSENTLVFNVENLGLNGFTDFQSSDKKMMCDKFVTGFYENNDKEFICGKVNGQGLLIGILKSKLATQDVDGFKHWLSQNPVTVKYQLAQKSIKTVGLTILDQNGQNVKQLMSFNGGTHFTTSSQEGSFLPSLTVDVVTNLEETLKVCSLEGNTM